ncbi:MAG: heparan-alpha-glucosaminide N-acetyltransferase domain-containing protein [Acidobacteriota bacterium]
MGSVTDSGPRLQSIDAWRGLIMIVMALDHVRDFFHSGAFLFPPDDLTRTTPLLFFTRWITHFCAPGFMFTAGLGAFLWRSRRHRTRGDLSRYLLTRGLWLLLLEVTVMRFALNFNFSAGYPVLLIILWALGGSMVALSALLWLPARILAFLSVAVIALHNSLDGLSAARFGPAAPLWNILHQRGAFPLGGAVVVVGYPLLPWIATMAAGYCFGKVFLLDHERRQKILRRTGLACIVAFLVLRTANVYGDPVPWSVQRSGIFTLLSFLNCAKYPPSLDFLLMTLGPSFWLVAWFDRIRFSDSNPVMVFGRVPLFFFLAHFYAIHALAVVMAVLRYGTAAFGFLWKPLPSMGSPAKLFPADFGYPLGVAYAVWILLVAALYPLCRWFGKIKARRRDWWLSYL